MTNHTIKVEGLPKGWEAVAYRIPVSGEHIFVGNIITLSSGSPSESYLIVQKTKPRRIVLEETGECNQKDEFGNAMNQYIGDMICIINENKIWREVKEE